jgi:hypothetical protein
MTIDWSGVVTGVTSLLGPAVTAALPIAGTILAIGVAWKLFKKFTK